jgi:DNA-binding MarR family transcriptional regulator
MANPHELLDVLRLILFKANCTGLLQKTDVNKLTFIHRSILTYLSKNNHQANRITDLVKFLSVSKPAMTKVIDVLERRKLITREKIGKDRRAYIIMLTNEGKNLLNTLDEVPLKVLEKVLADCTDDEKNLILSGLTKFLTKLEQINNCK